MVSSLGAAAVADAVRAARAAGMTALTLATVSDFAVLRADPVTGVRAHRDFRPGEAYADHRRQLEAIRPAVAAAGAEVATSAIDVNRAARDGRTVVHQGEHGDAGRAGLLETPQVTLEEVTALAAEQHYRAPIAGGPVHVDR